MHKPLLISTPAPARWPAIERLFAGLEPALLADLHRRFTGLPDAQDIFAVIADGGAILSCAAICRRGPTGVLGYVYTRPEFRERRYAIDLIGASITWFDVTGGKWLYAFGPPAVADGLSKFGFETAHQATTGSAEAVSMLRRGPSTEPSHLVAASETPALCDLTRADWPSLVALLQHLPGPDPRVPLAESAVGAERFSLDLVSQAERGACILKGLTTAAGLVSAGVVATDRTAAQTYGLLMPHNAPHPELRTALIESAAARGYTRVDFPMEMLAGA